MTKINPFLTGLLCRRPNCGGGPLFHGYLKGLDRWEGCGADLFRAESGDGPVVFILLIIGAIGGPSWAIEDFTLSGMAMRHLVCQ
ncbi:MAG: DUF983 domain-containing protein [Caulobacteraceae bacterium]